MRLRAVATILCCAFVAVFARDAAAAAFRDVRYDGTRAFDVFVPDRPGPHPVVVLFDGDGDKSRARVAPQTFVTRGYLLVVVGFRAPDGDDDTLTLRDASNALTWIARQVSSYGGDRERVYAWGVGRGARIVARIANEPERLTKLGAPKNALRGVLLSGDGGMAELPLPTGDVPLPPRLVLIDGREVPLAVVTASESLRALGCDIQVVPMPQPRALGASGDDTAALGLAWMESQGIERLQRAEQLRFAPFRASVPALRHAPDLVVGHGGALIAATRGEPAVWRADAPQAPWQREAGLESITAVQDLVAFSANEETRVALLLARVGKRAVLRARIGKRWRDIPLPAEAGADDATRVFVAAARDGAWLAFDRARVPLYRLELARGAPRLTAVASPLTAITGIAVVARAVVVATAARAGDPGGLFTPREDGTWESLGSLASWGASDALHGLAAVPDPGEPSRDVLLASSGSRVLRIDPRRRGSVAVELDLTVTFNDLWRALASARTRVLAPGFIAMAQPESGDRLWLASVDLPHPDRSRGNAWYLVRRADGRYAYGRAEDVLTHRAAVKPRIVPSPFAQHAGRAVLFFGESGDAVAGWFDRAQPRMGLWRDRADPQHQLFIARSSDAAFAYVLAADARGPSWTVALGTLAGDVFSADRNGLASYRRERDEGAPQRQDALRQDFALRFGVSPDDPACALPSRADASALAVLTIGTPPTQSRWCLEPAPGTGTPAMRGGAGLWFGGATDGGWTLALDRDAGPDTDARVLLFAFDAKGEPRWLEGAGRTIEGRIALTMTPPAACRDCAHAADAGSGTLTFHVEGPCPDLSGYAQIAISDASGHSVLSRRGVRLERAAGSACY